MTPIYDVVIYRHAPNKAARRDLIACVTFRAETPDGQTDADWMDACASGMAAYIGEIVAASPEGR